MIKAEMDLNQLVSLRHINNHRMEIYNCNTLLQNLDRKIIIIVSRISLPKLLQHISQNNNCCVPLLQGKIIICFRGDETGNLVS